MPIHSIGADLHDSNIYLVEGPDGFFLVDVGTGGNHEKVVGRIKEITPLTDILALVLTHGHYDHAGGVNKMREELGGVRILASEPAALILQDGDDSRIGGWLFGQSAEPIPDIEVLEPGSKRFMGLELEILPTPGHSEGSICLYHSGSGSLVSGDTIFTFGGVGRWDLPGGNLSQLVESIVMLSKLEVRKLYPGHFNPVEDQAMRHVFEAMAAIERYQGV